MPGWLADLAARLSDQPLLQGLLAALSTFVLEDPTTVGCGLLVAEGRMAFATAFIGVAAGIAIGDTGLYGIGRSIGPRAVSWKLVSAERLERTSVWFGRNMVAAVLLSRFVPGMRLPTYVGAGVLRAPLGRFVALAVGASIVWTLLLLWASATLGRAVLPLLGRFRWPAAALALLLLVVLQRRAARRIEAREPAADRIVSAFELWPPWLFYIPVGFYWLWLSLRFRGAMLPTAANPSIFSGGLIGESKSQILDLVPPHLRPWVAEYAVFDPEQVSPEAVRAAGLAYPLVAKPDVGQRGAGVRPIRGDDELRAYVASFPPGARVVLQAMAYGDDTPGPRAEPALAELRGVREAGVLYWRDPGAERGRIFSITLKIHPSVTGDGRRTLRELILADPRARKLSPVYLERHAARAGDVPAEGEVVPLVFAGNHCQGAVFKNGTRLATPELLERIDTISRGMPEFYFGRFDIRFDDPERFLRGEAFKIVEINGAGAEATHIWDASVRLADAYATLFEQFRILFAIGAANRARGHRPLGLVRFIREAIAYRRLARSYPTTW